MAKDKVKAGKYQIISKIAEGGMGAVYKALHPTLGREVIIKELTIRGDLSFQERFKREAKIMMDMRNENIVQVYDHFQENDSYYMVMEFVDGIALDQLIKKKKKIDSETAMLIFIEICKGLKYAHSKKVIHRDIKPANILISKKGEVKLTDFGIASSKNDAKDTDLTVIGDALGTPAYMSPEQIDNVKEVDHRSDIYSMGVMLYEMVTGEKPYPGTYSMEAINLICRGKYTDAKYLDSNLHKTVLKLIRKMMHCKISRRYKDLKHVISMLSKALKSYRDEEAIHNAIQEYIEDKPKKIAEIPHKKMSSFTVKLMKSLFWAAGGLLILGGAFLFAWINDYKYEYLKSKEYGALKVKIQFNKEFEDPAQRFVKASLYLKDPKNDFQEIKEVDFDFHETKPGFAESKKNYLPEGEYRIKIHTPYLQYYQDFYLNSRDTQKRFSDTEEYQNINFEAKALKPAFLNFSYALKNMDTKKEINQDIEILIYFVKEKKWVGYEELKAQPDFKDVFTSGKEYFFQFKKMGFYDHSAYIFPKINESTIHLDVNLTPVPGLLYISSNYEGMDILINRSNYYFTGGLERKLKEIDSTSEQTQKLLLSPGDYLLTIKKSKTVVQNMNIQIQSYQALRMRADYDKKQEKIEIKQE